MKNIKRKIQFLFLSLMALGMLNSCDETGDTNPGGTTTEKFAGEWFVIALEPDGETPAYGGGYNIYDTYNSAANDNTFWIDDHDSWMEIKSKVSATSFKDLTFSGATNAEELYTGGTVTVSNGKILKEAAHSLGGHVVDSIYFEAEFDWDPGIVYKFAGHRRTGFLEDEY